MIKNIKPDQLKKIALNGRKQRGVMVLEALIAILIFSLGILALMALQATAIRLSGDAKYRTDAAFLADKMIAQMWLDDPANLSGYAHMSSSGTTPCNPGGTNGNTAVMNWLTNDVSTSLPGVVATKQRISILAGNIVEVSLCWKMPSETVEHNYITRSLIVKNPKPT
jgi:type IV pilus assembly protein PilV